MKKLAFLLIPAIFSLLTLFPGCKYSNAYQPVNANNKFSVSVPSWMKEEKGLKEGADFQYANRYRNFYAIGEAISKEGLSKSPAEIMQENLAVLRKSMTNGVVTDSVEVQAGGVKGVRIEIYGKMSDENIYFSEVVFEGAKNIYHLSVWTRSENRKLHFKEDINKIIASFHEI